MRRNLPLFCYCVNEVFALLGCYVVYVGSCLSKYRESLSISIQLTTQERKDHMNSIISVGWLKREWCNGENIKHIKRYILLSTNFCNFSICCRWLSQSEALNGVCVSKLSGWSASFFLYRSASSRAFLRSILVWVSWASSSLIRDSNTMLGPSRRFFVPLCIFRFSGWIVRTMSVAWMT